MNHRSATLAIRARLDERALPHGALWRRQGEYAAGGPCDGCGERITSAQASYAVDFTPGVIPQSARFHRVCFEIWQHGSGSPSCHVRPDLIGSVAEFDGDHFIVDFTRREVMRPAADAARRR